MDVINRHLGIKVPAKLSERLEAQARREGNHVSAVTRRLLSKGLDQEEAAASMSRPPKRSK